MMNRLLILSLCIISTGALAQVQINKPLQLTGSGSDAKIEGIQEVSGAQDAMSVESHQKGQLIFAKASGSGNNYLLTLSPPVSAYDTGMTVHFMVNTPVSGPATLNVNGLGAVPLRKSYNIDLSNCDMVSGQIMTAIYDGAAFQVTSPTYSGGVLTADAGADQLNVNGLSVTLDGNDPSPGSGNWTIQSGSGGSFTSSSQYNTTFSGVNNTTYTLRWTVTNACGTSFDEVDVSFSLVEKRAFVTANFYTGNLGGLSGADNTCQSIANGKGFGGTWKAWLSSSTVSAASRLTQNNGPYKLINGTQIASSWADLTDGSLDHCLCIDQNGNTQYNAAWTNTTINGGIKSTTNTCNNWTSTSGNGQIGDPQSAGSGWADASAALACSNSSTMRLYCIEQ